MRSTFMGLETNKRGLFTQQSALYTTGHNISNANTLGYSRQRVNMQATAGFPGIGLKRRHNAWIPWNRRRSGLYPTYSRLIRRPSIQTRIQQAWLLGIKIKSDFSNGRCLERTFCIWTSEITK